MKFAIISLFLLLPTLAFAQTRVINLDAIRSKYNIPELGYAVITADGILDMKLSGYHRSDSHKPEDAAGPDDFFYLGDNTKAITGFVASRMAEDLKIKWLTEFFSLYPDWLKDCNKAYQHITLQQLMSGRSGIPTLDDSEIAHLNLTGSTSEQRKQLAKYLLKQSPVHPKGETQYIDGDGSYLLADLMLEKVSGKTWQQLITECLAGHMGLRVGFSFPNRLDTLQPWGHTSVNNVLYPVLPCTPYYDNLTEAASDIKMPLVDYAKFVQSNLRGLMGTDTMLTADSYRYLHFGFKDFSMGWNNGVKDNHSFSEHLSSNATFYCYTLIDNTNAIAFIVVANANNKNIADGLSELIFSLGRKYRQ